MSVEDDFLRRAKYLVQVAALAAAYFAMARISLMFAIPPGYATAVWPSSGIALAALILLGNRLWPGVWLGAALVNLTIAWSPLAAILIGTGNTLEALAGAMLVRRYVAAGAPYFDQARNVVKFVVIAGACATVAATTGATALGLAGSMPWGDFAPNWGTWWHGDTAGIIIVTPLVLTWSRSQRIWWTSAKIAEAAVFATLLVAASLVVFGYDPPGVQPLPLTFLILPFIVWAAFRFSRREVTTAIAIVCAIAIGYTSEGVGPFALGSVNLSLLALLAFVSTIVATGLMMSAAVAERARAKERLEQALFDLQQQAARDPLTGMPNRRVMWDFLQREWIRARRRGYSIAVIMIDLDHFKSVNDEFGHDAGDHVLTAIGRLLLGGVRGSDVACRFGGEEFAIVMSDTSHETVMRRAESLRESISRLRLEHRGRKLPAVTASIGVALLPTHATDPESLLRAADQALYEAKTTGRDRIRVSVENPAPAGAWPATS